MREKVEKTVNVITEWLIVPWQKAAKLVENGDDLRLGSILLLLLLHIPHLCPRIQFETEFQCGNLSLPLPPTGHQPKYHTAGCTAETQINTAGSRFVNIKSVSRREQYETAALK